MNDGRRKLAQIVIAVADCGWNVGEEIADRILADPVSIMRALGGELAGMDARMRTPQRQSSWLMPFGADLYYDETTTP